MSEAKHQIAPSSILKTCIDKHGDHVLFCITRDTDSSMVVYKALRYDNILMEPFAECFRSNTSDYRRDSEISDTMKALFFGSQTSQVTKAVFQMMINAFPGKVITLHLKKSGRVVATMDIDGAHDALLQTIHVRMGRTMLGMPDVVAVELFGLHKKTKAPVSETINVTDDMRKSVDVTSIF